MNRSILFLIVWLIISVMEFSCTPSQPAQEETGTGDMMMPTDETPQNMLRHVVLFKFKDTSSAESIDSVITAFRALPDKISEIQGFEWGTDVSPENLQQGFTHCFFLTFADAAGRDAYLPHPDHKAFGQLLGPHLDKVLVVDYFVED